MAFIIEDLRSVLSLAAVPTMAQAAIRERRHSQLWHYATPDPLNSVLAFNYFGKAGGDSLGQVSPTQKALLRTGDIIVVTTGVDLTSVPADTLDLNINAAWLTVTMTRGSVRTVQFTSPSNFAWSTQQLGTGANTTKTNLYTYNYPGFITTQGQGIRFRALLKTGANANNKTITLETASGVVLMTSGAVASNNESVELWGELIRGNASNVGYFHGRMSRGANAGAQTAVSFYLPTTLDLNASQVFNITATNGTAAANDVALHTAQVSTFGQ
jgi:hypothetical protein